MLSLQGDTIASWKTPRTFGVNFTGHRRFEEMLLRKVTLRSITQGKWKDKRYGCSCYNTWWLYATNKLMTSKGRMFLKKKEKKIYSMKNVLPKESVSSSDDESYHWHAMMSRCIHWYQFIRYATNDIDKPVLPRYPHQLKLHLSFT